MKYKINPKIQYRKYLKSVIIENQVTLNDTATFIFLSFKKDSTYEEMLEEFKKNYKVIEGFESEVSNLLNQLIEKNYILEA